jgi:hypothetical protein
LDYFEKFARIPPARTVLRHDLLVSIHRLHPTGVHLMSALLTTQGAATYLSLSMPTLERLRLTGDGSDLRQADTGAEGLCAVSH